ncbi:MAG: hypothetical protein R2939_09240 [Kofleriaceae bacterium]
MLKRTPHSAASWLACLSFASLAACGGDDPPITVDSAVVDAPVTATCDPVAYEPLELAGTDDGFAVWAGNVTTDLGADSAQFSIEFYDGIRGDLTAQAWDLADAVDGDYATCASCFRIVTSDAEGNPVKQFFQSGGTLTVTMSPFASATNPHFVGTVTDLAVEEVLIDFEGQTFASTPVPNGACYLIGDVTFDLDAIPDAWTCAEAAYNDGTTCNCACGANDPDCDDLETPVMGCTNAADVCVDDTCTEVCDVFDGADPCAAGVCGYFTADLDICYVDPTVVDAAALGAECASDDALFCAVSSMSAGGVCDTFVADDGICREVCDDPTDCTNVGDTCAAIIGDKGVCVTPPVNDTCATAIPLVLGTAVQGSSVET